MTRFEITRTCNTCGRKQDVDNVTGAKFSVRDGEVGELIEFDEQQVPFHPYLPWEGGERRLLFRGGEGMYLRYLCPVSGEKSQHSIKWQLYDDDTT